MKIRTQFILSVLVFGILIVAISASAIIIQQRVARIVSQENTVNDVSREANDLSYIGDNYMIYQESQQLSTWQSEFTTFSDDAFRLQGNTPEEKSLVGNIQADVPQLKDVFDSMVSDIGNSSLNQGGAITNTIFQISWSRMSVQNQELVSDASNLSQLLETQANQERQINLIVLIGLICIFAAYFLINYLMIQGRTLKSISKLKVGTTAIGAGNLDFKIEEKENDEIGELSHAFNLMTTNLKNVTSSKTDLEKEIHERAVVEESLRRSEEKFRSMNFSMNEGVCLHEIIFDYQGKAIDYKILDINPAYEQLTGITREKAIGKKASELYGTGKPPYFDIYERVAASGQAETFETYFTPMLKYFSISAFSPQKGQFGTVFTDITERKRMEEQLLKSRDELELRVQQRTHELAQNEEKYRTLFNSIDEGFCIVEVIFDANNKPIDYRFLEINESFERQTGLHDAEGKLMRSLAPTHEEHWFQIYGRIALTGKPERFVNDAKALNRIYDVFACRVGSAERRRVAIVFNDITARKKAEEALEKANDELELKVWERTAELEASEEKYRRIVETANEGIWVAEPDGKTILVNQRMAEMLGYAKEELQNRTGVEFLDEGEKGIVPTIRQELEKGSPIGRQLKFRRKDGNALWTIANISPLFDRQGKHIGNLSMHTDITERVHGDEMLKDSQKRLLDIIDGAPNSIFVKDLQGRFITINTQLEKLLGQTREEIKGKTDYDIISRDQADNNRDNERKIAANDKPEQLEEEANLADGKRHYFLANKFPLHDIHGKTYAVASVSTDITEIRQAERAVKESEEKFSKIFHSSPVGMVMTQLPEGRCVDVNEAYLKMLEFSREEVIGRDSRQLNMHIDPDKRDEVFRSLGEQGKVTNIELRFRTKTGRILDVVSSIDRINLQGQTYSLSTNIDITARKQAEAEIIHLASFPELNPSPVLEVEPNGTVIYANPGAKIHFPLMTQGLKHQFLMDFINSLKKAGTQSFTKDVKIGDYWYEETLALVSTTKNFTLYARDITERKNAEVDLQETRDYLNNLLNYANAPIIVWDPSFHITQFNHAFEYLTGRSAGEIIGKSLDILFPEEQREHSMEHIRRAVAGERMEVEEIGIQHKDGSVRTVLWNSATLYDQDNQTPTATIAQGQDITERKKAEDALKASEEKYRDLFENMVEEVHFWQLVRDDDGEIKTWRLVDVNPPALRTWGRQTVDEIRGKTTDEIFGPGSTEHFMPVVQKIMMEGVPYAYEDYFPNLNKYFRFTSVPLGEYFITTGSDITEIKQNEESLSRYAHELEASNKELEAFSYSVSHDLRAPLRSITGFSTILLEDYREKLDDEGKLYLKKIEDSGELMGQLMDDLLKLSRVTRSDLNLQRLDLSDMAHKIVDELRKDEPNRKVKVTIAPNMTANGDKNLLGLVLQNLLGNAWKYSSKTLEPRIEMGIVEHNGKQAYFVRDNGVGFDMTYANKLFQPFQRLHKTTEFAGTGIGLATVQRIIRRHGGEVWAEAKVGEGATFYFTLS